MATGDKVYIADKETLDTVNANLGATGNTGGSATAGTAMAKLNNLIGAVGATGNTGGSATAGTAMAKLNNLIDACSSGVGFAAATTLLNAKTFSFSSATTKTFSFKLTKPAIVFSFFKGNSNNTNRTLYFGISTTTSNSGSCAQYTEDASYDETNINEVILPSGTYYAYVYPSYISSGESITGTITVSAIYLTK